MPFQQSNRSVKKRKLHIGFDPEARTDYLTGFRKRKADRRKFGLTMEELKRRKRKAEERKELQNTEDAITIRQYEAEHRETDQQVQAQEPVTEAFNDANTLGMFGDVVTVTTTLDGFGADDEVEDDTSNPTTSTTQSDRPRASFAAAKEKVRSFPMRLARHPSLVACSTACLYTQVDAQGLTTKGQRRRQRNEAQANLKKKRTGGGKMKGPFYRLDPHSLPLPKTSHASAHPPHGCLQAGTAPSNGKRRSNSHRALWREKRLGNGASDRAKGRAGHRT